MNCSDSTSSSKNGNQTESKYSHLRNKLRHIRSSLSTEQQTRAAEKLLAHILADKDFKNSSKIAFYKAFDGEIDPALALEAALQQSKNCFLPVISPDAETMAFVEYAKDSNLSKNHFGILEPALYPNNALDPEHMDIIFMPLVAFDKSGNRLGMGKGYYDKKLAFMLRNSSEKLLTSKKRPKLIGLAHECQGVEKLERADWDVPMDKIITDQCIYTISS